MQVAPPPRADGPERTSTSCNHGITGDHFHPPRGRDQHGDRIGVDLRPRDPRDLVATSWVEVGSHGTRRHTIMAVSMWVGELLLPLPPRSIALGMAYYELLLR